MNISRRKLMLTSLGATQLCLLSRFNLLGRARAAPSTDRPTKLLTIYVGGGLHHEFMWSPFYDSAISRYIAEPDSIPGTMYDASKVANFDGSGNADAEEPIRRLRTNITWNWADPADRTTVPEPANKGYAWAAPDYALYENTAVIHGIDQGTAAHESGLVASLCGIAGGNFAIPSIPAVIANHMIARFPDRPVPSVSIGGRIPAPAVTLSSAVNPTSARSVADLEYILSDRRRSWEGLRARHDVPALGFDGTPQPGSIPATLTADALLRATRAQRGRSTSATDAVLEQIYDGYAGLSRTIARDVVAAVEGTPAAQYLPERMPWTPNNSRFGWTIGYADGGSADGTWANEFDLTLKLLKSDVATSVSFFMPSVHNFDAHSSTDYRWHSIYLRGVMETIGRLLIEMKLTPSPSRADRTLLDETLVYITSEFGRTFPMAGGGSDHNPMHSAVLVNGLIQGNRMIGGYREGPFGVPMTIRDESGDVVTRPGTARDVAATIYACFGMEAGVDYFIPGGYGSVEGIALV